jgi:predicted trehalose synthase
MELRLSTDVARAERIASERVQLVSRIFMDAYVAEVAGTWAEVAEPLHRQRLLKMKLFYKALYEINYEAEFRPTWGGVPLKGALALMSEVETAI